MIKYSIGSLEKKIKKEDKTIPEWIITILVMTIGMIWLVVLLLPILIFIIVISLPVGITEWLRNREKSEPVQLQLDLNNEEINNANSND